VLRFWNHQLRGELEAVRFEIWHALMERTGRKEEIAGYLPQTAPSPQPSPPMGEREKTRAPDSRRRLDSQPGATGYFHAPIERED